MAAEFDGWGAGRHLIARYHGFSKQRQRTLRHTIENLRHTHGTNICTHIDLFGKLCTQMSLNDPANPPTEEQKIDWFLDTVTEKTYDSVNATCLDSNIAGTLTFNKLVKLYTHKFFPATLSSKSLNSWVTPKSLPLPTTLPLLNTGGVNIKITAKERDEANLTLIHHATSM